MNLNITRVEIRIINIVILLIFDHIIKKKKIRIFLKFAFIYLVKISKQIKEYKYCE